MTDLAILAQQLAELEARCAQSTLLIYTPEARDEQFFHSLCTSYLADDPQVRAWQIMDLIRDKGGIRNSLAGYAYQCAEKLQETRDETWLRIGLAATELANDGMDYRDMLLIWAELYVGSEEAGLDPIPAFTDVANNADFGNYAVVRSRRRDTHVVRKGKG
jgi:hypothetical protein